MRIDSAHVIAIAALFIALGGTAYALTRNEVKSKHIAPNAVRASDERDLKWKPLAANGDCDKANATFERNPEAAIDNQSVVHLRGSWRDCTGPTLATLPAKYRPAKFVRVAIGEAPWFTRAALIGPTGSISVQSAPAGVTSLDGVTYSKR